MKRIGSPWLWCATSALSVALVSGCADHARSPEELRRQVAASKAELVPPPGPTLQPKATGMDRAWQWHQLRMRDENGVILPGVFAQAVVQREALVAASTGQPNGDLSARDGGLSRARWVSRGPDNVGGRTRCVSIDPRNSSRMIAGAVGGGLWRSNDTGVTWQLVDDYMASIAICCLARDPANPDVLYAGTGEGFFNGDAIGGYGIYKSTNNGLNWTLLPATAGWDTVNRITVCPTNSNFLLAAKRYGGIMRSMDGGNTWSNPLWAQGSFYVAYDPVDGRKAVATIIDYDFSRGDWVHRALWSGNYGGSWFASTGPLSGVFGFGSRLELAYAPSSPSIVYAASAGDGKIYRSTDGGRTYAARTTSGSTGSSWYTCPIWVSPTDPDLVLAGGYHIMKSTDGGVTLNQISDGYILTEQPHPDIQSFASDPGYNGTTNKKFWVTSDGALAFTPDITIASASGGGNNNWSSKYRSYRTTQFYGAVGHGPSGRIVGGTQDNGTLVIDPSSDDARLPYGGDGGFCAIDHTDPQYIYGEYINLIVHRSTNGGFSSGNITNGLADAGVAANFIAPIVLDPRNPNVLYGGGRSLWRSRNVKAGTPTWSSVKPAGTDNISAIAIAPSNNAVVWVGQNNGEVYRTTSATQSVPVWNTVDNNAASNPFPNRYVTRILIDPADEQTVYVALGGWSPDNLWKTTNSGATWTGLSGTGNRRLPSIPIYGLARHPQRADFLYVSTEMGVYASSDGGQTWSASNEGPANTRVDEINFLTGGSTILLAATHGRGMWTADIRLCDADFNGDGFLDGFDYDEFVACFESGGIDCPPGRNADFNADGFVDGFDYDEFVGAFETGC